MMPAPEAPTHDLRPRLRAHLAEAWATPVEITGWRRFPVGMSWITYGFTATLASGEVRDLILRLGDPKGLFAPYSTEPEYQALTALAGASGVPIPRLWLRCEDTRVLGAPFLVTARVEGDTPTPWSGSFDHDEAERESLANDFTDALGALHAFDWRSTRLAQWAEGLPPHDVARREALRWASVAGYPEAPLPVQMHYALRWLQARAPVAQQVVLAHGDYRVGNFLRQGRRITAILDWELVHLGDPHADLAWADLRAFSNGSGRVGGLVDRAQFHRRYSERSGIAVDPHRLRYYAVMMQFKSAAMLLGAARRVDARRAGDVRMAAMSFQLAPTLVELNRLLREAT